MLKQVKQEAVVRVLQELVRASSVNPPGNEEKVSNVMARMMKDIGLSVTQEEFQPGRFNTYGVLAGRNARPILLLNGHVDVVPPGEGWSVDPFSGVIKDGRLYGRGSSDMKGGLAAMIVAAKALIDSGSRLGGSLMIMGAADEEVNMLGTKHFLRIGGRADFAIVGEPTDLHLCTASKGDVYYEITTIGKAAHASVPEQGINAIYKMQKAIEGIKNLNEKLRLRVHPLLGSPTLTVGTIEGGTITCAVPGSCKITIDRRTLPSENAEAGRKELQTMLDGLSKEDAEFKAELEVTVDAPPMEVSENEPVVSVTKDAVKAVMGVDRKIEGFSAVSDASNLVNAGIPSVVLGPGSLNMAHTVDESIPISEVTLAAQIYAAVAIRLLGP